MILALTALLNSILSYFNIDLYRKEGKIPEGIKQAGGVRQWTKQQLDKYITKYKVNN